MMGTWPRMFCLNVSRDVSYSPIMDVFSARTACSATTRALVGVSSTTGRMKSGSAPLDSAILITFPFDFGCYPLSRSGQVPELCDEVEQDRPEQQGGSDDRGTPEIGA